MGSERLAGKVLRPVMGKPLLGYHLERLRRAHLVDRLVLATSTLPEDDPIADYCAEIGITCYRGAANDLVSRYQLCVAQEDPQYVIRVTADCPLIDPGLVDALCQQMLAEQPPARGDHNDLYSLTPPRYPRGLDAEIMTRAAFDAMAKEATSRFDREHVTAYLHRHKDRFRIAHFPSDGDYRNYRWVVDYAEDFQFVAALLAKLLPENPAFAWTDCLAILQANPELMQLNQAVIAQYDVAVAADIAADKAGE